MLTSLCLLTLITPVVATPPPAPHEVSRQRPPTPAPFYTLRVEHQDKVLNNSYIIVLKDDLHASAIENHLNSQKYNGHLSGYAVRFTDAVIQRIREVPEVAYTK